MPWKSKRDGAEKTQTVQMMVKATATMGMTMANPAGMRARKSATLERPVSTCCVNMPSARSEEPAVAPKVMAAMNPKR